MTSPSDSQTTHDDFKKHDGSRATHLESYISQVMKAGAIAQEEGWNEAQWWRQVELHVKQFKSDGAILLGSSGEELPPPNKGDYVLATKYSDGDPGDHWCVGFYDSYLQFDKETRHKVVDAEGNSFRASGFKRVAKIDRDLGAWLLKNAAELEHAPLGTIRLWDVFEGRRKHLEEME
jgi:hypothetical protein